MLKYLKRIRKRKHDIKNHIDYYEYSKMLNEQEFKNKQISHMASAYRVI